MSTTTNIECECNEPRVAQLREAARATVADGWTYAPLHEVLPGDGWDVASPDDVAIVEAIIGKSLRFRPDWRTGEVPTVPQACNVALLRSQLKRWAISERNAQGGAGMNATNERVIGSDAARAVGRFREDGPTGYRAATMPDAPLRASRADAVADERAWLDGGAA